MGWLGMGRHHNEGSMPPHPYEGEADDQLVKLVDTDSLEDFRDKLPGLPPAELARLRDMVAGSAHKDKENRLAAIDEAELRKAA